MRDEDLAIEEEEDAANDDDAIKIVATRGIIV
jgi:hypothetical protein